jgi:hypothetical protein
MLFREGTSAFIGMPAETSLDDTGAHNTCVHISPPRSLMILSSDYPSGQNNGCIW